MRTWGRGERKKGRKSRDARMVYKTKQPKVIRNLLQGLGRRIRRIQENREVEKEMKEEKKKKSQWRCGEEVSLVHVKEPQFLRKAVSRPSGPTSWRALRGSSPPESSPTRAKISVIIVIVRLSKNHYGVTGRGNWVCTPGVRRDIHHDNNKKKGKTNHYRGMTLIDVMDNRFHRIRNQFMVTLKIYPSQNFPQIYS